MPYNHTTYGPANADGPSTSTDTLAKPATRPNIETLTTDAPNAATTQPSIYPPCTGPDDSVERFCKAWNARHAARPPVAHLPGTDSPTD